MKIVTKKSSWIFAHHLTDFLLSIVANDNVEAATFSYWNAKQKPKFPS